MVRKNYFEILDGMNFNPSTEFDTLCILLSNGLLEELNHKFLNYQNRRTFIDFDEFLKFCLSLYDTTEQLFVFSELLVDIFNNLEGKFTEKECQFIQVIFDNITRFLELANHELITLENGDKIIVEKNVYASEVSQIVSETSIQDAIKVLEYNHFANKGNVQRKKEILISLANYLEPLRKELNNSEELKEVFKVNNQKIIAFEKLFEMYNNFGLRHNNSNQYHLDLADDELEQWYDDIYTSTLFVILSMDESRILSKLKTLREE